MNTYSSLINLFHQGESYTLPKAQLLLRTGEPNEYIYYVVEGAAYSYQHSHRQEKVIQTFYGPGDILPVSSIRKLTHVPANFETLTPIKLHRLPVDMFLQQLEHDAHAAYDLARQVADQYAHYVQRIGNLQYTNAYDRLVYCLLMLSQRFGKAQEDGSIKLTIPLTHSLIASTVNVARETASRSLKRLAKKGLLTSHNKHLIFTDIDLLVRELHDSSFMLKNLR